MFINAIQKPTWIHNAVVKSRFCSATHFPATRAPSRSRFFQGLSEANARLNAYFRRFLWWNTQTGTTLITEMVDLLWIFRFDLLFFFLDDCFFLFSMQKMLWVAGLLYILKNCPPPRMPVAFLDYEPSLGSGIRSNLPLWPASWGASVNYPIVN